MSDYVQIPVPVPLAPAVFQLIADYLSETEEELEPTWTDLADDADMAAEWWRLLRPEDRHLIRALAAARNHSLETTDAADRLRCKPADLAGILGPLSRRARRDGYPSPVESRQERAQDRSGRRVKILTLADGVADIVERYDIGEPRPVRKRARSAGAIVRQEPTA
jgi:hypothetical protein